MENNNEINNELQKKLKWYESKYGPYYEEKGLKNWKNLFRKPTLMECIVFIVVAALLFGSWAYKRDLDECYSRFEALPKSVCDACDELKNYNRMEEPMPDFSNLSFVQQTEVAVNGTV